MLSSIPLTNANAASLSDQLAELGHPNTKMCQVLKSSKGLGKLLVVQFKKKATRSEDQQEAIALLEIIVEALNNARQRYVGFEAVKRWDTCQNRDPGYVYWRDYDDNWRNVGGAPLKYLTRFETELEPTLRGTPAEAFVLFSLGLVEQRLNRITSSVNHFEKAYDILQNTDDPNGIKPMVLVPLIHHHFGQDGDEKQGQAYLNAYALVAKNAPEDKANYLPLIKVAPVYPSHALRMRREGYVLLEFTVDADGSVINPVVIEESPKGIFGAAAIKAAQSFRYIPTIVDGVRVPTDGVRNKITFEVR